MNRPNKRSTPIASRLVRSAGPLALMLVVGAMPMLVAPSVAEAQIIVHGGPGGGMGMPGGPGARLGRAAIERYGRLLGLDDAQQQAVAALHEAYTESNRAAGKQMSEKMRELEGALKDGDMDVVHEKMPAVMEEHRRRTGELEKSFLDDLRAVLTNEQLESNWPRVERLRKRDQWLRTGVLSGSNVDLTTLVEDLKLPAADRERVQPTLEQYEQDMDRALTEVQRAHDERAAKNDNGGRRMEGGRRMIMFDNENFQAQQKSQREESGRIKELNQRYARLLAADLPEELRGKLEEQFKFASFRQIYRESTTERKLAAAEKFDDLTPEQRERLRGISESYRRQARSANDRWSIAQERAESEGKATGGGGMGMVFMNGGQGQPEDLREARTARRDLDKQTDSELDGLLSDSQRDRLPKARTAQRGGFGEDVDVLTDGEHGAVFISAIETADEAEDGSGVVVQRSVIVSTDQPPAETEKEKKSEPK